MALYAYVDATGDATGPYTSVSKAHDGARRQLEAGAGYSIWTWTGGHTGERVEDGRVPNSADPPGVVDPPPAA
jgi:hypothetical protein